MADNIDEFDNIHLLTTKNTRNTKNGQTEFKLQFVVVVGHFLYSMCSLRLITACCQAHDFLPAFASWVQMSADRNPRPRKPLGYFLCSMCSLWLITACCKTHDFLPAFASWVQTSADRNPRPRKMSELGVFRATPAWEQQAIVLARQTERYESANCRACGRAQESRGVPDG